MSSYIFQSIIRDQKVSFTNKLFLWIWHADKIPPHIGVSLDDKYFSLKVSGKDNGLECSKTLNLALSKGIPLLLVELKSNLSINEISFEFDKYPQAKVGKTTCLTPICTILNHPKANQLSELLISCETEILNVKGFKLPANYSQLKNYTACDIQKRLQLLTNENRKISIS